jgi:hypothetical protein
VTGLLPTLPGKTRGVVAVSVNAKGRNIYTLQCENCYALETPEILTQMKSHFHLSGDDRRRLCEDCRRTVFAECECFQCKEERRGE